MIRPALASILVLSGCDVAPGITDPGDGGGGGTQQLTADLPCDVADLVSTACASCHSSPPSGGAPFPLLSQADFAAPSPRDPSVSVAVRSLARLKDTVAPMPPAYSTQPTAAQVDAFSAWVSAGLPKGSCQTMGPPDAGPVMLTCTSGAHWTLGNLESPAMNPGLACRACHLQQEPLLAYFFMGTIYPKLHEEDLCDPTPPPTDGVIEILDSSGAVKLTLRPNSVGNFYNLSLAAPVALPYRARVRTGGRVSEMMTPQGDGDCNGCHTATGANGAPGRIVWP